MNDESSVVIVNEDRKRFIMTIKLYAFLGSKCMQIFVRINSSDTSTSNYHDNATYRYLHVGHLNVFD